MEHLRRAFSVFPPEALWLFAGFFCCLLVAYLAIEFRYHTRYWRIVLKESRRRRFETAIWTLRLLLLTTAFLLFGLVSATQF